MTVSSIVRFFNRHTGFPRLAPQDLGDPTSMPVYENRRNPWEPIIDPYVYFTAIKEDSRTAAAAEEFHIYAHHGHRNKYGELRVEIEPSRLSGTYTLNEAVDILTRLGESKEKMPGVKDRSNLNDLHRVLGRDYSETSYRTMDIKELRSRLSGGVVSKPAASLNEDGIRQLGRDAKGWTPIGSGSGM
jgi:hypothetical protein